MADNMRPASIENPRGEPTAETTRESSRTHRASPKSSGGSSWIVFFLVAVTLGVCAFVVVPLVSTMYEQDRLAREGTPAPAKILAVRETNSKVNHRFVYELHLEVYPEGKDSYQVSVSQPFSQLNVVHLRAGGAL